MDKVLFLTVWVGEFGPKSFEVIRKFEPSVRMRNSVLVVSDFPYTPWPRENGNLLWQ